MPKEKVSMGLATYGRTYKLVNNSNTGIGAPSSGAGEPGKYTRESGFLAYYEVRKNQIRFDISNSIHFRYVKN
jgi:GH18 family chitinase